MRDTVSNPSFEGRRNISTRRKAPGSIYIHIHNGPAWGGVVWCNNYDWNPPSILAMPTSESPNCSTFGLKPFRRARSEGGQFSSRHRGSVLVRQQSLGTLVFRSGARLAATLDVGSLTDAGLGRSRGERRSLTLSSEYGIPSDYCKRWLCGVQETMLV